MPRLARLVLFSTIILATLGGCRDALYQTYGFERKKATLRPGATVSLLLQGRSVAFDSAGRQVDRTGSPYWVVIYVDGVPPADVREIGVTLTGRRGATISPPLSPLQVTSDSGTVFAEVHGVPLPHEDHVVTVSVRTAAGAETRTDTVRLSVRPTFSSENVSFLEWLSRQ